MLEKIKSIVPDNVYKELSAMSELNTKLRLAHFLSQCSHESGSFKRTEENLNYSRKGLLSTFPNYFTATLAQQYEYKPEKIGSRVYANRMGNGNEDSKDGYKFRGRGFLQVTGKNNYVKFGQTINQDLVTNPDLVSTKYPLASALWFFKTNNILSVCDEGSDRKTIEKVTKLINGGLNGIEERVKLFNYFYSQI